MSSEKIYVYQGDLMVGNLDPGIEGYPFVQRLFVNEKGTSFILTFRCDRYDALGYHVIHEFAGKAEDGYRTKWGIAKHVHEIDVDCARDVVEMEVQFDEIKQTPDKQECYVAGMVCADYPWNFSGDLYLIATVDSLDIVTETDRAWGELRKQANCDVDVEWDIRENKKAAANTYSYHGELWYSNDDVFSFCAEPLIVREYDVEFSFSAYPGSAAFIRGCAKKLSADSGYYKETPRRQYCDNTETGSDKIDVTVQFYSIEQTPDKKFCVVKGEFREWGWDFDIEPQYFSGELKVFEPEQVA